MTREEDAVISALLDMANKAIIELRDERDRLRAENDDLRAALTESQSA
jgi:hypothetical protein